MNENIIPIKVCHGKWKNYCYLIRDHETLDAVIIDPAWELSTILQKIRIGNICLKAILLTHAHEDHTNLAYVIQNQFKVPVFMHANDIEHFKFRCNSLEALQNESKIHISKNLELLPIWTPGHTYGSVSFLAYNCIFTGDTLFIEGCGTCFASDNGAPDHLFNSLNRIKSVLENDTKVFPGHCYGTLPGESLINTIKKNIYLNFNCKEDFVQFRMRHNQKNLYNFC